MNDDNWELIDGDAAHDIEFLNYSSQINVIEALCRFLMHTSGVNESGCKAVPNERALKELHRTGTLFLLQHPGEYRTSDVHVGAPGGKVIYAPPAFADVPKESAAFIASLEQRWQNSDPISIAAYALWRINWIHPFKNGNGRSARAFAYACLCLKFGFMLPGTSTVIDLIMLNRDAYYKALSSVDKSVESGGEPVLDEMVSFLANLVIQQLSSAPGLIEDTLPDLPT